MVQQPRTALVLLCLALLRVCAEQREGHCEVMLLARGGNLAPHEWTLCRRNERGCRVCTLRSELEAALAGSIGPLGIGSIGSIECGLATERRLCRLDCTALCVACCSTSEIDRSSGRVYVSGGSSSLASGVRCSLRHRSSQLSSELQRCCLVESRALTCAQRGLHACSNHERLAPLALLRGLALKEAPQLECTHVHVGVRGLECEELVVIANSLSALVR